MDDSCKTRYPIMLIHGIGYTDDNFRRYWGRIPEVLEQHGARICFGKQDAFGDIRHNAQQLKISAKEALEQSGAEKLNFIAHSRGGIEARYMISKLDMANAAASLTTLATPHRGILSMDKMREKAKGLYRRMLSLFNLMLVMDGGQSNTSFAPYEQLTADYMKIFNELVPDAEQVYYQSYAFDMKNGFSDPSMGLFYYFIKEMEGPNDGLVSVESAKWGDFQGIYPDFGVWGISHPAAADSGICKSSRSKAGEHRRDITYLYMDIAGRLKNMGY